jgi:hypothetical protein
MDYEEMRDRMWHMKWSGGLTPEETALGCTITDYNPYPNPEKEDEE